MAHPMSEDELRERDKKARDRRALRLGAFILVPVLLFYFGVKPLNASLTDMREQLELERSALVRERAAIAAAKQNPQLQHIADSLMHVTSERLFTGADDTEASANLGFYIGEIARDNHFLLSSATTGAVSKTKSVVRTLSEDIRGESDLQGILEFLQALERGPKLVRISRFELSRPQRDADDIETIVVAATITSYALPPESPMPAKSRAASDSTKTTSAADTAGGKKSEGAGDKQ